MADQEVHARVMVTCRICNEELEILVPLYGYLDWKGGTLIQDALPDLDADSREALISNTCGSCFDRLFGEEENHG